MSLSEATGRAKKRLTVEPVFLLYTLGLCIGNPASQQLIYTKYCERDGRNGTVAACKDADTAGLNDDVQAATSRMVLCAVAATVGPMLAACAVLGSWSDRRSRKTPILVPLFGGAVACGCWALQASQPSWDPAYTLVGCFVHGASGYFAGNTLTVYSYLTAAVPAHERTFRIAVMEASATAALLIGSLACGLIMEYLGITATFILIAGIDLLAAAYCLIWLDDISDAGEIEESEGICRRCADYFKCVLRQREGRSTTYLHSTLAAYFVSYCAVAGVGDLTYLFLTKTHNFSPQMFGYYTGTDIGLKLILGSIALAVMKKALKFGDLAVAISGCASGAAAYATLGTAVNVWMIWAAAAVGSVQFCFNVGTRSFVSKIVAPCEQGRIFAFLASGEGVVTLASAVIFNDLYPASLSFYPGLSFVLAAILCGATCTALSVLLCHMRKRGEYERIPGSDFPRPEREHAVQAA